MLVEEISRPSAGADRASSSHLVSIVTYRLDTRLRRRTGDLITLVLAIGILGGVAMAAVAAGRATQSAYAAFLARTNASDLTMSTYGNGNVASANNFSPTLAAAIDRLPGIRKVDSWVGVGAFRMTPDGAPEVSTVGNLLNLAASKGEYFDLDRATPVQGRLPDPRRADEFMTTAAGAHALHLHVGQVVPVGFYTAQEFQSPGFGTPSIQPAILLHMRLAGVVVFNDRVIIDDTDQFPANVVFTPALTKLVADSDTQGTWYSIKLANAFRDVPRIEEELVHILPTGSVGNFSLTSVAETKVEGSTRPEAIALGAFGLIAALATIGIALSIITRHLQSLESEHQVLRAVGAPPVAILADGLVGIILAVVAGAALAEILALVVSPLSPLGPIRQVYHPGGLHTDVTVMGLGLLVLVIVPVVFGAFAAYRRSPGRLAHREQPSPTGSSVAERAVAVTNMSLAAGVGLRFALEPGSGRSAVPTRSVLAGTVIAVTVVTATLTFGSGLQTLITQPALYGWNWNFTLEGEMGVPPQAQRALSKDTEVAAWSGYQDLNMQVDGETVPALLQIDNRAAVAPPTLSGHGIEAGDQIVLGAATLSRLHARVGQRVAVGLGSPNTAPLYIPPRLGVIVGTATFPSVAGSSTFADHTSMGTGALISKGIVTASLNAFLQGLDPTLDGPSLVFVRLKPGISRGAAMADMRRIVAVANDAFASDPNATGAAITILGVQRPAEIVNYQATGDTPLILAAALAFGAVLSLSLNLVASVRRRARAFALLKTLGFTRRQLAATISCQATTIMVISLAIGIPLGIVVGRQLWVLFAKDINAVPRPTVPLSIAAVAIGGIVLANLVAAIPRRLAVRTPAALVLRAE